MSIRDDLAVLIGDLINVWRIGYDPTDPDGDMLGERLADAVLAYLGQLDPDADAELIAWHLKASADELAALRATIDNQSAEIGRLQEAIGARDAGVVRLTAEIGLLRKQVAAWRELALALDMNDATSADPSDYYRMVRDRRAAARVGALEAEMDR